MHRNVHYEQAFEEYLRSNRVPYISVDETRKALLPASADVDGLAALKSFDFVVYAPGRSLLVDVKGRMYGTDRPGSRPSRRFENWVTADDIEGMMRWESLFGREFQAIFVFAYCLRQLPPDTLYESLLPLKDQWYALREVPVSTYRRQARVRSPRWGTMQVPQPVFERISRPFSIRNDDASLSACGR